MRVLVAYGSEHGATAEIAQAIGSELAQMGIQADVHPADEIADVRPYDAVILGSGIYSGRWAKAAVKFGKRYGDELAKRPVWLFDSGPIDTSADEGKTKPVMDATELAARTHAREHVTFGGQFGPEDVGRFTQKMIGMGDKSPYGDFRNFDRIRAWARTIGGALGATQPVAAQ